MEDHFLEVFILKFCTAWKNALLNNLRSPEKTTRMTMKTTTTVTTTTRSTTKKLKTRNWKTKKTSLKERRLRRIRARAARSRPFRDRRETISKKKMKTEMEKTNFTYVFFSCSVSMQRYSRSKLFHQTSIRVAHSFLENRLVKKYS